MGDKGGDEPASFTDINNPEATGQGGGDMTSTGQKLSTTQQSGTTAASTGATTSSRRSKKKKKKKKKKSRTKTKRRRRKDRYESQNYLLRIEGTLCCSSLIVSLIYVVALFAVLLICGIWSKFDFTATTDSVKQEDH